MRRNIIIERIGNVVKRQAQGFGVGLGKYWLQEQKREKRVNHGLFYPY